MLQKLTNILRVEDVPVQNCLNIISIVKKMNTLDEQELRLFFLQHRLCYIQNLLNEVRYFSPFQYVIL
jgi:hypothetical protein